MSGVPFVPFSECKITDFFHNRQIFSQLFFKKNLREKDKALKDNALRPEKNSAFCSRQQGKGRKHQEYGKNLRRNFSGFMPKNMVSGGKYGARGGISRRGRGMRMDNIWGVQSIIYMEMQKNEGKAPAPPF